MTVHLRDPWPVWKQLLVRVLPKAFVHAFDLPQVCKGSVHDGVPLMVDSGASVCIAPRCDDFTVYRTSKVKIKDLSKSNTVAGEGFVRWKVRDTSGKNVNLDLPGYHIPMAEVRLLSPQVFLSTCGKNAKAVQTSADLLLCLGNGAELKRTILFSK